MEAIRERPSLKPLQTGREFQTFVVTGKAGMQMPPHISTKEAVVIVRKGEAILKMDDHEHKLTAGEVFIIPGSKIHSLSLNRDFNAIVLMARDSRIEFK